MKPRVTVCIPVYNEVDAIERTLDCVKRQTLSDFKAIISDNCSTDGTFEKITSLVYGDPRFEVIRQSHNLGSPKNFKFLASRIDTECGMFIGSHDEVSENLLEDLLTTLDGNKRLIGVVPRIVSNERVGALVQTQFDLSDVGDPVRRYLIILLGKHFAVHALYKSKPLKAAMAKMPNLVGSGALFLCRMALLGRIGTSNGSTYHFRKRVFRLSHQERRQRHGQNMQLGSTRFAGTRLAWAFLKLVFGAELSGKRRLRGRLSLIATYPAVLVRYCSQIAEDYTLWR